MDQSDLLNDLLLTLECGICLEQLEITSRVLPCQHTFCLRCLEGIVRSQKELRCPECRTLVEIPVHDLPTNILLNRLLEGIKKTANITDRRCLTPRSSFRIGQQVFSDQRRPVDGQVHDVQSSPSIQFSPPLPCKGVRAKALSSFDGHGSPKYVLLPSTFLMKLIDDEMFLLFLFSSLTFKEGDVLNLLKRVDRCWFEGEANGKRGLVPANYVRIVPMNPECRALYDFQIASPEQVDCLAFQKDEVITVIRKVDENWAEGKIGDRKGIFPISFVEFNPAAKSLLDSSAFSNVTSTPISTPTDHPNLPQITASSNSSPNPNTIAKVYSVPSLRVEVNTQVNLVSSPNPTANGLYEKVTSKRHSFCEAQTEAPVLVHQRSKSHVIGDTISGQPISRTSDGRVFQTNVVRGHEAAVPIYYVALYNYRPANPDELELRKGEIYVVSDKCQDGWYRGRSLRTSVQGVFPGNYVQVAR